MIGGRMLTTRSWLLFGCALGIAEIVAGFCWAVWGAVEPTREFDRLGYDLTPQDVEAMGEEMQTGMTSGLAVAALGGLLLTICVLQLKKRKKEAEAAALEEELTSSEEPPPLRPRDGGP
jgi:LPXTG-motif cell wall-anchored protein